jgi:hypothetical protein
MTPLFWWIDRRRDHLGVRTRRWAYLTALGVSAWFVVLVPIEGLVMEESARVTRERAVEVLAAARDFHRRHGRYPESFRELAESAGRRLPSATLGIWEIGSRPPPFLPSMSLSFGSSTFVGSHHWTYNLPAERWSRSDR